MIRLHPALITLFYVITFLTVTPGQGAAEQLRVVATFSVLGDFAANVGGDKISLTTLVAPDSDVHVFEPRPVDAHALLMADVVITNGLGLEGWLKRLIEASGTKADIVTASEGSHLLGTNRGGRHFNDIEVIKTDDGREQEPSVAADPHAWHDISNAKRYVENIMLGFCAADPVNCGSFRSNSREYIVRLEALDKEIRSRIAAIPRERRTVIASHAAFSYLGRAYELEFLAPEGVSTESEATANDIAAIIDQIREDKASALFVENISDPRLIEQISAETGLKNSGVLFSDALSGADGPAPTYIDMMRHNISTIVAAIRSN